MALWNIPQRAVILRADQLKADSATALESAYTTTNIGQTEMADRATSFPFTAVNDALLNSAGRMVELIGLDTSSHYRTYFKDVTASLASGADIPTTSATSKPIIGVIGDVRDAVTNRRLTAAPYADVIRLVDISSVVTLSPHHYYSDNKRIWHSRTNVVADVVIWSETDQRVLMNSTPNRGECPFPESLLGALIEGALSFIFRGEFNKEQAEQHWNRWNVLLQDAGIRTDVEQRIATA